MMNPETSLTPLAAGDEQEKVISLFRFIMELYKLRQKNITHMADNTWCRVLSSFPDDPEHISVFFRDCTDEDTQETNGSVLFSVRKPEFTACPAPHESLRGWLADGWESFRKQASVIDARPLQSGAMQAASKSAQTTSVSYLTTDEGLVEDPVPIDPEISFESFDDDESRVADFNDWSILRQAWVEKQHAYEGTAKLFSELYRLYFDLQRNAETTEFILANGILRDKENAEICHPILTKRIRLRYDPDINTIYAEDTDAPCELYVIPLRAMNDINLDAVKLLQEELAQYDYHPFDRIETPQFLKRAVRRLSDKSIFSENGIPKNWYKENRILIYTDPCFIVRNRLNGTVKAIEQIIENVQETGYIPNPIIDIVSGGKIDIPEADSPVTIEEQLAAVGGESVDFLLSKEANKEQLEIARRIGLFNAVLVQGPPGTGKTHSIANLLGHFLAQGKSVLVTSHTSKALSVLKDKLVPGLRNLCVSMLEDSNTDMEKSVDGITDYMAATTSFELKNEMTDLALQREQVIRELADVRKELYEIIRSESTPLMYGDEEISPSQAAQFICENEQELAWIPGTIDPTAPFPFTMQELCALYRSNTELSAIDEAELSTGIPNPDSLLTPDKYEDTLDILSYANQALAEQNEAAAWTAHDNFVEKSILFTNGEKEFSVSYPDEQIIRTLQTAISGITTLDPWMEKAIADGKNGGAYRECWQMLINQIQETVKLAEDSIPLLFGKTITLGALKDPALHFGTFDDMKRIFSLKGKLSKLDLLLDKKIKQVYENVRINGVPLASDNDCDLLIRIVRLQAARAQCASYWNPLMQPYGISAFDALDANEPERIAENWIHLIQNCLDWYETVYAPVSACMEAIGIPSDVLFASNPMDSEITKNKKLMHAVINELPEICNACTFILQANTCKEEIEHLRSILQEGLRTSSTLCKQLLNALECNDPEAYSATFASLKYMYTKYDLLRQRNELLGLLQPLAPQWAQALRDRDGVHGEGEPPANAQDAWKWVQLNVMLANILEKPFTELQARSVQLSREYRKITAAYAEKSAWYHLLCKTEGDIDMRHALQGWKQTVQKIGKGMGKNAPALKAKARELMSRCQTAVPAWIMPIGKALESLNPKENSFDIIIIDEASQSDVASLAILYMGKKLIIVGDDKQVSPMAIGVQVEKVNALQQMYIKDKIPNDHLYDAKTSVYDIAKTTFQPLMLREHFRCVPEIIGFSNMLSYDCKIKPLRDTSENILLPNVIRYHVADGKRLKNKTNPREAQALIALLKACLAQPEYEGKSFGIISLLGDEQVKVLQRMLEEQIDHKDIVNRSILCGNASNFQGDERDVIFLSVVDSKQGDNPLRLQNFGADDAFRKRYNVAVSRARDQLWVVDSLNAAQDLKAGDLRKMLLDYTSHPLVTGTEAAETVAVQNTPFEDAVAQQLQQAGYRVTQNRRIGTYLLDMVVSSGRNNVVIECDADRCTGGEAQIRNNMERQTILERLGWRFIRIRGSEYYRNPAEAMRRLTEKLAELGITTDSAEAQVTDEAEPLLPRITAMAEEILRGADSTAYTEAAEDDAETDTLHTDENDTDNTDDCVGQE